MDGVLIFDNSIGKHELIAQKSLDDELIIHEKKKFFNLKDLYDNYRRTK